MTGHSLLQKGANVVLDGDRSNLEACFFEPTILTNVNDGMRVFHEEIFGPVAALFRLKTDQGAIDLANKTAFRLTCYFYSRDLGRV